MTLAATPYCGRSRSSAMRAWSSPSPAAAPTSAQTPTSGRLPAPLGTIWGPHGIHAAEQPAGGHPSCAPGRTPLNCEDAYSPVLGVKGSPVQIRHEVEVPVHVPLPGDLVVGPSA